MKKLKLIPALVLLFFLLSGKAVSAPYALTNHENDPKEKLLMDPDESKKQQGVANVSDPASVASTTVVPSEEDSSIHSVNKFNYIFYFLYKLKYDEEGTPEEYLDYLF